jgi:hypothetical protein
MADEKQTLTEKLAEIMADIWSAPIKRGGAK